MKIIIVGAGIAGLSTYLFLEKYLAGLPNSPAPEITIYEAYQPKPKKAAAPPSSNATSPPSPSADAADAAAGGMTETVASATFEQLSSSTAIAGGGLGVSPNGMRLLRELSGGGTGGGGVHGAVQARGYVCENFVFLSSRGWRLMRSPTGDGRGRRRGAAQGPQAQGQRNDGRGEEEEEEEDYCVSISRQGLWECLLEEVKTRGKGVVVYRKVAGAWMTGEGGKGRAGVRFEDGGEEEADLVVGADGVKSVVLKGIHGADEVKPEYRGLIGVGGFVPGPIPELVANEKALCFTFGPNGFFGYGASSPDCTMWWSTCEAADPPSNLKISVDDMRAQLKEHHGNWKDPVIQGIIEKADVESVYPVWMMPELSHWGEKGLVVVGDAAHALDPTSGQGASQAFEDAKCLALLLSKFMDAKKVSDDTSSKTDLDDAIAMSIKSLHEIRSPRIHKIAERTKKLAGSKGNVGFAGEMMMCFFFWLMGKVPAIAKLALGDVNKELNHWDMEGLVDAAVKKHTRSGGES